MHTEHKVVSEPIDKNLQGKMAVFEKDGWRTIPGVPPIAVYHLVRELEDQPAAAPLVVLSETPPKPPEPEPPAHGPLGKLLINDTLISVGKPGEHGS